MMNENARGLIPDVYIGKPATIERDHIKPGYVWVLCAGREFVLPRECVT